MRVKEGLPNLLALSRFLTEAVFFITAWETDGCKVDRKRDR